MKMISVLIKFDAFVEGDFNAKGLREQLEDFAEMIERNTSIDLNFDEVILTDRLTLEYDPIDEDSKEDTQED